MGFLKIGILKLNLMSLSLIFLSACLSLSVSVSASAAMKSQKKLAADVPSMNPPQVLEKGDVLAGLRAGQGRSFEGESVLGASLERMVSPNVGIIGQVHYASYESSFSAGPVKGKWEYKAWTVAALAAFHADLFKAKNLDTYFTGGVAHTFLSSTIKSNVSNASKFAIGEAESDSTYLVGYFNLRYFLNSEWGVSAAVGTGLGTLALGMDYVF